MWLRVCLPFIGVSVFLLMYTVSVHLHFKERDVVCVCVWHAFDCQYEGVYVWCTFDSVCVCVCV